VWRSLVREVIEQEGRADLVKTGLVKTGLVKTGLAKTGLLERIDVALHGLCQPLTVLQCRLAMGELIGDPDAMREAIREGLLECERMNQTVGTMREMLQQVMVETEDERTR
jgi:hypothetical protein